MDLKGAEVRNFYKLSCDIGTNDETIGDIRIPHYQRPYKWGKDIVKQLLDDWSIENQKNNDGEYFAGSIVTVSTSKADVLLHQLIDGQQRFTTIYLTNFLLFLLLRTTIREALVGKQQLAISSLLDKFNTSIKYAVTKDMPEIINIDELEESFDAGSDSNETALQKILDKYLAIVHLPSEPESEEGFSERYIEKLSTFTEDYLPRLSYDRSSYNLSLCKALSRIVVTSDSQHALKVSVERDGLTNGCIEFVYLDAIEQIFTSLVEISEVRSKGKKLSPFKKSLSIIDSAVAFLEGVKLCVIQTGSSEDAYTLFEVLNDRSLALDDLDLVKNQFYRSLCISSKNTNISEEDIDKEIVAREEQWGDKVFKNNTDTNNKLIAFLATTYLTGSTKIGLKSHDKFRDEIKEYLNKYKEKYSCSDLHKDFSVFECIRQCLDIFEVKANGRVNKALEAEFSNKTDTFKTVHLLLALGHEGVLSGLVSFILQYIKLNHTDVFSVDIAKKVLGELVSDSTIHQEVHEQAKIFWKTTLIAPDYKPAKEIANHIIQTNDIGSKVLIPNSASFDKKTLESWLTPWRYRSNEVRVKVLFYRLLQLDLDGDSKLKQAAFSLGLKSDEIQKMHLDHMEPSSPEGAVHPAYYKYGEISRDDDVNALGNMFPMPGSENMAKSNKPMYTSFDFLDSSGLKAHWLTVGTKVLFEQHHKDSGKVKVPTQEFFIERKKYLIDKFYEAILLA